MRARCGALLVVAAVLVSPRAFAHQTSVKYVDVVVDGTHADVTVRVAPGDVTEPMHLPPDARPPAADAARAPEVAPYVAGWLALTSAGAPCTAGPPAARVDPGGKLVAVSWRASCPAPPDAADFTRFFALDRRHVAIVRIALAPGARPHSTIVRASGPHLSLRASPSLLAWIGTGMQHIYDGRDHISFVLALLLVVMLARDALGNWRVSPLVPTLRSTATVITAFTVGHSMSLIAASLGWVQLPSRLVESLIAVSIAYTAAEDVVRPDVPWRFGLSFGFGLVHGLGFASTLSALLPPHDVVVPLLCFNCGVELGQLTIVVVALPLLVLLAHRLGGDRYRRVVMPAMATVIFLAGAIWVIERVFQVTLLGM